MFNSILDDDTWGDDWGTPAVKTVKSAAEKKAERDAKMKARKVFSNNLPKILISS